MFKKHKTVEFLSFLTTFAPFLAIEAKKAAMWGKPILRYDHYRHNQKTRLLLAGFYYDK